MNVVQHVHGKHSTITSIPPTFDALITVTKHHRIHKHTLHSVRPCEHRTHDSMYDENIEVNAQIRTFGILLVLNHVADSYAHTLA